MVINKAYKKYQAESLIKENKLYEAKEVLQKICRVKRNDYNSWCLLALVSRKLGQISDAEQYCKHVLARKPEYAQAWHLLGSCMHCKGDLQNAISSYLQALKYNPKLVESYFFMANAYREGGKPQSAIEHYKNAVSIDSNHLEALANLGATLREIGNYSEAASILHKANKIKPDTPQILCNLALLSMDADKPDEALFFAKKANSVNPEFIDPLRILGSIYSQTGRIDDAISTFREILKRHPDDFNSKTALASIFEKRNAFDDALNLIEPLINSKSYNHETLVTYSRLSDNISTPHDSIKLLIDNAEDNFLSDKEKIDVYYELGRRFDKARDYDKAFHYYKQANCLTRKTYPGFIGNRLTDNLNSYLPKWTKDLNSADWHELPTSTNDSRRPIFIVGMHRSGTTLTEQILSTHSHIYGAGEVMIMPKFSSSLEIHPWSNEDSFLNAHKLLTTDKLDTLADEYLNTDIIRNQPQQYIIDNLHYNFANISLIYRIFPKACIIHVSRNPIDNCLSIYFQKFGLTLPYTTDLNEIAIFYKKYDSIMKYWKEMLDIKIINIKYEDLVMDPASTSKKMIEFCGLEWEENCLNFYKNDRDVNTPSYYQVRQPVYTKSLNRWKHYIDHIQPLIDTFG